LNLDIELEEWRSLKSEVSKVNTQFSRFRDWWSPISDYTH